MTEEMPAASTSAATASSSIPVLSNETAGPTVATETQGQNELLSGAERTAGVPASPDANLSQDEGIVGGQRVSEGAEEQFVEDSEKKVNGGGSGDGDKFQTGEPHALGSSASEPLGALSSTAVPAPHPVLPPPTIITTAPDADDLPAAKPLVNPSTPNAPSLIEPATVSATPQTTDTSGFTTIASDDEKAALSPGGVPPVASASAVTKPSSKAVNKTPVASTASPKAASATGKQKKKSVNPIAAFFLGCCGGSAAAQNFKDDDNVDPKSQNPKKMNATSSSGNDKMAMSEKEKFLSGPSALSSSTSGPGGMTTLPSSATTLPTSASGSSGSAETAAQQKDLAAAGIAANIASSSGSGVMLSQEETEGVTSGAVMPPGTGTSTPIKVRRKRRKSAKRGGTGAGAGESIITSVPEPGAAAGAGAGALFARGAGVAAVGGGVGAAGIGAAAVAGRYRRRQKTGDSSGEGEEDVTTGEDEDSQLEYDDEDDEEDDDEEEEEEDEEQGLIARGGVGIPIGEDGLPHPLLDELSPGMKGRKCLVLDLDETLVHSSFKMVHQADYVVPVEIENQYHNVYVIKRPGVDGFLKAMGEIYEIVIFTASLSKYADPVLDQLDIHRVVQHRLFRESCYNNKGNYVKDLSQLGRAMKNSIIIDNSPASYVFHPNNAVPISSWFNDPHDSELTDLIPFLTDLERVDDIRSVLDQGLYEHMSSVDSRLVA